MAVREQQRTAMNSRTSTGQPSKMHAPYSCTILLSKFSVLSSSSSCKHR